MIQDNQITYYDFNDINYSGYFLTGFIQNERLFGYGLKVSKKIPALLFDPAMGGPYKKTLPQICLFGARIDRREFYFCIDCRDSCSSDPERLGWHLPLLEKVRFYFKVNYNEDVIRNDHRLAARDNIIPVPLFFPLKPPRTLPFFQRVLPNSAINWSLRDTWARFRKLSVLPGPEDMGRLRRTQKDLDVFFVTRFYGQEHHSAHNHYRLRIMKEIKKHPDIVSMVGMTSDEKLRDEFSGFEMKALPLRVYLKNLARARIAIYVRGLHDCISYKLGQYLALGLPIVGQPILNNRKMLYEKDRFPEQFAFDDPVEIARRIVRLLNDPEELKTLGDINAKTFDACFTPARVVSGMLKHLF